MDLATNGRVRIGVFAAVAGVFCLGCCAADAGAGITLTYDFVDESGDILAVMHLSQTTNGRRPSRRRLQSGRQPV